MYMTDNEVDDEIELLAPFCTTHESSSCTHCDALEVLMDLRDARKELAELRAWREQVFLVVRQLESTMAEHHRIVESLKK